MYCKNIRVVIIATVEIQFQTSHVLGEGYFSLGQRSALYVTVWRPVDGKGLGEAAGGREDPNEACGTFLQLRLSCRLPAQLADCAPDGSGKKREPICRSTFT